MVPKVPVGNQANSNTPKTIPYVDVNYTFLPYQLTSNRYLPSIKTGDKSDGQKEENQDDIDEGQEGEGR